MVKVNTNSNTIKVNAASAGRASNLSIGTPQSYYDGLAKEWAISDNLVQGIDYSSKYYANIAKSNADSSKANLDSVRDAAEEVIAAKDNALNDISDAKINTLESLIDEGNNQIELIKEQGSSYATKEDAKYTAGNGIDITDNIISNTQTSAEWGNITGNIENQEDLVNYVKKYSGGLEVCDIGMSLYIDETKGLRRWLNGQIVAINQNTQGFLTRLKKIVALYPSLLTTEENWQAAKTLSDYGQVGKFVFNYAQAEVEKQCSIFGGEDILTSEENYWLVEKAKNDVEVGDLAYPCDSSGTKTGDDAAAITAVWTGTYTGEPIISITESGNNGKSFYSEVTLTETVTTDEIVSFRLPAVVNVQGLLDLQNLGMTVEAGLPNIKSENIGFVRSGSSIDGGGAIKVTSKGRYAEGAYVNQSWSGTFALNAADSSSYYKDGATVQSEAIQYPYYIQIATGQETEVNIRNDIESIVPYTLFDSKYSEAKQYNASRVLGGSILSKSVYPTAYEAALVEYNSEIADGTTVELPSGGSYTKRGVSGGITVKLSTDETVTEYDWKLDTMAEILTVPTLNGSEDLLSDRYDDLELKASSSTYVAPANGWYVLSKRTNAANQTVVLENHTNGVQSGVIVPSVDHIPRIYIPAKKNDVIEARYTAGGDLDTFRFIYAKGNGSLYFFVASVAQNAPLANLGRIEETKVDKNSSWGFPSNRYIDLELGASGSTYTAPANGWYYLQKISGANNQHSFILALKDGETATEYGALEWTTMGNNGNTNILKVPKGKKVQIHYNLTGATEIFRFIYAEGSY